MVKPISPKEAIKNNPSKLPKVAIRVFNGLIKHYMRDGIAYFSESAAVEILVQNGIPKADYWCFNYGAAIIAEYRKAGWRVEYKKETMGDFNPTFTFRARK